MAIVINLLHFFFRLCTIIVVVDVFLSYILSPYHPIRSTMDRLVEPFLAPIRKLVPPIQMIDFSPIVLLIALQVFEFVLVSILSRLG